MPDMAKKYCAFCGQSEQDGRELIGGLINGVFICDECVENLEQYLRENYPDFGFISSTTKRLTRLEEIQAELDKNHKLVVLDYDLNHDEKVLSALESVADRIEILVDEICFPGCQKRKRHYEDEALIQLTYEKGTVFPCPNRTTRPSFAECKKRPSFISNEEIDGYIERGYTNFKIVGRGLPQDMVLESYLYYLVKEEEREFIHNKIDKTMASLLGAGKKK